MSHLDSADTTLRLRAGLRVTRRGDDQLQVGLHAEDRVVLCDTPEVRRLLGDLGHGVRAGAMAQVRLRELAPVLAALRAKGLLETGGQARARQQLLNRLAVGVVAPEPARTTTARLLAAAGLQVAGRHRPPAVLLHVTIGAEPDRGDLDTGMRAGRPHLLVTATAGRTRLGPLVVPGVTACQRCVDEHLTDRDPRHPLVVEQHSTPEPRHQPRAEDLQLALAWAARDLVRWAVGARPASWSATLEVDGGLPVRHVWARHPRCGCAWGDALAG